MANLFIDGCEHYAAGDGNRKYEYFGDSGVLVGDGYRGTNAMGGGISLYTQPRAVKRVANSPVNELIWGHRFYAGGTFPLGTEYAAYVLSACHYSATGAYGLGTAQLRFNVENSGKIEIRTSIFGGLLATSASAVLIAQHWQFIEYRVKIHTSAGEVEVRVDGVPVVTYSGNTAALGSNLVNAAEFIPWQLDDIYINDTSGSAPHNTFYGPTFHVRTVLPAADDSVTWVPSAGANYACVDDTTPDGTTSVGASEASGIGDQDTYQLATIYDPFSVITVQANVWADASYGGYGTLRPVVKIDGVTYDGDTSVVPGTPFDLRHVWPTNPATGLPWTVAQLNAARWGFRRIA